MTDNQVCTALMRVYQQKLDLKKHISHLRKLRPSERAMWLVEVSTDLEALRLAYQRVGGRSIGEQPGKESV